MNSFLNLPGIRDCDFLREEIPMTKEEVREVSVCKLHLCKDSVFYDIGSGTGSVSVEVARLGNGIKVYAMESNSQAAELTRKNAEKFNCENICVIETLAPDGMEELPAATHAFIGGTRGRLESILDLLYKKNPRMRIVMNAVTLDSVCEMKQLLKNYKIENLDITQICVNKVRKAGNYDMLAANNPVFIFSFDFSDSQMESLSQEGEE